MAGIVEKIKGFLFSPSETFDASKEDTLGDAFKYCLILLLISALLSAVIAVAFSLLAVYLASSLKIGDMLLFIVFIEAVVFIAVFISVLIGGAILLIPAQLSAVIAAVAFSLLVAGFFRIPTRMLPSMPTPAGEGAAVALAAFIAVLISVLIGEAIDVIIGGLWLHIWVYLVGGRKGLTQTFKALMYGATPSLLLGWISLLGFFAPIWVIWALIVEIWALIVEIIGIRQLHEISTGKAVAAVILAIIIPLVVKIRLPEMIPPIMPYMPY